MNKMKLVGSIEHEKICIYNAIFIGNSFQKFDYFMMKES